MNNDKVTLSLNQDGLRFSIEVPKIAADRMGEITLREKDKDFRNNQVDLLKMAIAELQKEGKLPKEE